MINMDRRQFIRATAASSLLGSLGLKALGLPEIRESGQTLTFEAENYKWEWSAANDRFRILDLHDRLLAGGPLQPAVIVKQLGQSNDRRSTPGKLASREVQGNRMVWTYTNVNGSAKLAVAWRFEDRGLWIEPVTYVSSVREDIVSLNFFAEGEESTAKPSLEADGLVLPGICESDEISPITNARNNWNMRTSLGRAGTGLM